MVMRNELMSSVYVRNIINFFYTYGSSSDNLEYYLMNLPKKRYINQGNKYEVTGTLANYNLNKISEREYEENRFKHKVIRLKDNNIYSLNPDETKFPYVYPAIYLTEDKRRNAGELIIAGRRYKKPFVISLYCYDKIASKKNITIGITALNNNGGIRFSDKNSGNTVEWKNKGIVTLPCSLDKDGKITIEVFQSSGITGMLHYAVVHDEKTIPFELPQLPE